MLTEILLHTRFQDCSKGLSGGQGEVHGGEQKQDACVQREVPGDTAPDTVPTGQHTQQSVCDSVFSLVREGRDYVGSGGSCSPELSGNQVILGLSGPAGSGKTTTARHLVKRYGFYELSFATPIKNALNALFGWDYSKWEDREWKESPLVDRGDGIRLSPRRLAQWLGTEAGRAIDPDIWVNYLFRTHERMLRSPGARVVISDVRFDNEATAIRGIGGRVIHLDDMVTREFPSHASEIGPHAATGDWHLYHNPPCMHTLEWAIIELMAEFGVPLRE